MKVFFRLISIILLFSLTSCSSKVYSPGVEGKPLVEIDSKGQKYNLSLNFRKKNLTGFLVVRKMETNEIRIVGVTQFGLSLFDFGLLNDQWTVYSCVEPMNKKKVLNLLESDFKIVFSPNSEVRKIEREKDHTKYIKGRAFTKNVTKIFNDTQNIEIKHSWIGLTIQLERLKEDDVE